ncbi:hypothetical protein C2E25_13310 [Geothermobacter hydrogeniphilus]|uniref:Uncharacterized protein n=1 Tax=Geothermobacter hydrogeniphilus TaxID=1969733 RepID=A0A2K2H7L1_9BACT|nr:hypothetical protein C2E25_13310 [Geothermobacter hydrogeniphilus]
MFSPPLMGKGITIPLTDCHINRARAVPKGNRGKNPLSDKKGDNYQQDFADKNPPVGKNLLTEGARMDFRRSLPDRKDLCIRSL